MATVLVMGASRGIGLAFVQQHLGAGDRVLATARDEAGLLRLRSLGAEPMRLDVADTASMAGLGRMLDGIELDRVLYVAGVMDRAGASSPPTREAFDRLMHTNLLGAMQALPLVAPQLRAGGCFAAISSQMAHIASVGADNAWLYRVSKAALNMALASARHGYPQHILAALSPGWVQTDMGGAAAPLTVGHSVAAMCRTLDRLTLADSGGFFDLDGQPFAGW